MTEHQKNDIRERYSKARAAMSEINHLRSEALKPFDDKYKECQSALFDIEEEVGGEIDSCFKCGALILPGDNYCPNGDEGEACEDCAHNISDVIEYLKWIVEDGNGDEWRSHEEAVSDLTSMENNLRENGDSKVLFVKEGW